MIDPATGPSRIGIMNGDGKGLKSIVRGAVNSPAWRPDHKKIIFVKDGGLAIANPDGTGIKMLTPAGSDDDNPEWSPDGQWIVFDRGPSFREDIYKIRVNGTGLVNLTKRTGEDRGPDWSPDGKKIAYVSTRGNGNREIYVMDANGKNQTNVTTDAARDVDPAWSPDGKTIVFASDRGKPTLYLWFLDVATLEVRRAVPPGAEPDHDPVWSPDGTKIAFHRGEGGRFVVIADIEGHELAVIEPESQVRLPAWK